MRLFRHRRLPVPTLPGLVLLLLLAAGGARLGAPLLYRFLAAGQPAGSGSLVVEGWIHDHAIDRVAEQVADGRYARVYTVGGPIPVGSRLAPYATFAEMTAARLAAAGLPPGRIEAVPADPALRDRTWASARALRDRLALEPGAAQAFDLVTVGPHARRSRLTFRRVFGRDWRIGTIVIAPEDYDGGDWWRSSQGFRSVLSEALAYAHACLFRPRETASAPDPIVP